MLDKQILRSLILEALKNDPATQLNSLLNAVERLAIKHKLLQSNLTNEDRMQVIETCWDLITERIITPGTPKQFDSGWPHFHTTPFGNTVIGESLPHYYDPDAYIKYLKGNV